MAQVEALHPAVEFPPSLLRQPHDSLPLAGTKEKTKGTDETLSAPKGQVVGSSSGRAGRGGRGEVRDPSQIFRGREGREGQPFLQTSSP